MGFDLSKEQEGILAKYSKIMLAEQRLHVWSTLFANKILSEPEAVWKAAGRIEEIARSSLVVRGYIEKYGLSEEEMAYESVGAHTNLMLALLDLALTFIYGANFGEPGTRYERTVDGYTYREIMEAARIHDLPENLSGDICDDGARDEAKKEKSEELWYDAFFENYAEFEKPFAEKVRKLIKEMTDKSSMTGRLLYLADKTAAVVITLTYDDQFNSPRLPVNSPRVSKRDREEIEMCDVFEEGRCRASEMWTIDHLVSRNNDRYDETGFFLAMIVMYTLKVNDCWYEWREKDYL